MTTYHEAVASYRRLLIRDALVRNNGDRSAAARELGLERTYLQRLIAKYQIDAAPGHKGRPKKTT